MRVDTGASLNHRTDVRNLRGPFLEADLANLKRIAPSWNVENGDPSAAAAAGRLSAWHARSKLEITSCCACGSNSACRRSWWLTLPHRLASRSATIAPVVNDRGTSSTQNKAAVAFQFGGGGFGAKPQAFGAPAGGAFGQPAAGGFGQPAAGRRPPS